MRIGVISDTHVPVRARALPGEVFEIFAGVDLILHAVDLVTLDVLEELETIAPVLAVHGNVDRVEVLARLPATRRLEVWRNGLVKVDGQLVIAGGLQAGAQSQISLTGVPQAEFRALSLGRSLSPGPSPTAGLSNHDGPIVIGLVHGHEGTGQTSPERAASHFPDANIVVFGHSHQPMSEWHNGRLLLNPGSATNPRRAPRCSVAILEVGDGVKVEVAWVPEDTTGHRRPVCVPSPRPMWLTSRWAQE